MSVRPLDPKLAVLLALLGVAAWVWWQKQQSASTTTSDDDGSSTAATADPGSIVQQIEDAVTSATTFKILPNYIANADAISAAETSYGLPADLLARLLYQESHYRSDIITGAVRSPTGAVGIAQFEPATAKQYGVDPLNVPQAIDGAGRFLSDLYAHFGDWNYAVAAYNWGQGNVDKWIASGGARSIPKETQNYVAAITGFDLTTEFA